jgi:hypothetical protein
MGWTPDILLGSYSLHKEDNISEVLLEEVEYADWGQEL